MVKEKKLPPWTRVKSPSESRRLHEYANNLHDAGVPEREVARAYLYADCFGLEALTDEAGRCIVFGEPDCEDWNCLNPTHQITRYE